MASRWQFLACILFTALVATAWAGTDCENRLVTDSDINSAKAALGRIVILEKTNIRRSLTDQREFFADDLSQIIKEENVQITENTISFYEKYAEFQKFMAREASLDGSSQAVSLSLSTTMEQLTSSNTKVSVARAYVINLVKRTSLPKDAIARLSIRKDIMDEFQSLPTQIKDPHLPGSWNAIGSFLSRWGTHIITSAYTGNVYESFSSAEATNSVTEKKLKVKACVEAEGLKPPTVGLKGCAGFSESDRKEASIINTLNSFFVRGGSKETRVKLVNNPFSSENLEAFLLTASTEDDPVEYGFEPLWTFLRFRFSFGDDNYRRTQNLEAYYEGLRGFDCRHMEMKEEGQTVSFQLLSAESNGWYRCMRRCIGCHSNADCHVNVGSQCQCYGPSALDIVNEKDQVAVFPSKSNPVPTPHVGCNYVFPSGCKCDPSKKDREPKCDQSVQGRTGKFKAIWEQVVHSKITDDEEIVDLLTVVSTY